MTKTHMAVDQYGNTYHDLGPFPRKELLKRLGKSKASKMYMDYKSKPAQHIGWVIGQHWLTVYKVSPLHD